MILSASRTCSSPHVKKAGELSGPTKEEERQEEEGNGVLEVDIHRQQGREEDAARREEAQ